MNNQFLDAYGLLLDWQWRALTESNVREVRKLTPLLESLSKKLAEKKQ